ncbi:SDR family oxidoreductase [Propionivibrio sp.]|uniref:SDR family oxidoreductase n=1 Tax=Propionivibrio sp. TaxID=2212460 RepID=UPI003BEFD08A
MDNQKDFTGQVVLITGGSRGIGYATAEAFLRQGAQVATCAMDENRLVTALAQLAKLGEVAGWRVDISDFDAVDELVRLTLERFGRIDVLVNNAARIAVGKFAEQKWVVIDEIIDVNIKGTLYVTHTVLPHMLKRGAGCVINISSSLGTFGMSGVAAYCASKFALVGFTEALAQEVKWAGVRVYGMTLSMSATDMQVQFSGYRDGMPPEIVAEQVLLLAGPNPPIETGTCLKTYL